MPTIVTSQHGQEPTRTSVSGNGHTVRHECRDAKGHQHRQRLALGSVGGIFYVDASCPYCGAHLLWVEEESPDLAEYRDAADRARS